MLLLLKEHKVSTGFTGEGHQDKAEEEGKKERRRNKTFDDRINPTPPFLFTLRLTPPTLRIHNIHKRLFRSNLLT